MARGLINIVTDIQGRGQVGAAVPVPGDTGLEAAFRSVDGDFARIGKEIGRLADHAAKVEGGRDGKQAGMDPEFRTRQDGTLRGEAFDAAGLQVAETRLRQALTSGIEGLYERENGNPAALAKGIDGVVAGVLKGAPDELRPELQLAGQKHRFTYMRQAARDQIQRQQEEQKAALQGDLAQAISGMHQRAFTLGLDDKADQVIGSDFDTLRKTLGRKGLDGKPLVDPSVAGKLLQKAQQDVTEARLLGAFDRLPGHAAKVAFMDQLEADWAAGRGVAKVFSLDGYRAMQGMLGSEMRREESRHGQADRKLAGEIKQITDLAEQGFAARPDRIAGLRAMIANAGRPELVDGLDAAENLLKWQHGARATRPEQLEGWLRSERGRLEGAGGATASEVDRLKLGEKLLSTMRTQLKDDPNGWGERAGYGAVPPLDFSAADKFGQSLAARMAYSEEIGARYGQAPQYLRPDDRRKLVEMAAPGGAQLLDVVKSISSASGDKARRVLAELGDAAPTLAMVGGLVNEVGHVPPVMQDVANGVALLRSKDFKSIAPAIRQTRVLSAEVHGGALGDLPATEQALIDATNYAFDVRVQRHKGDKSEDMELWKRTFREMLGERSKDGQAYGGIGEVNGGKIIVPPDVRNNRVGELIGALSIADFGENPPRTSRGPASITDLRQARLVSTSAGRYRLNVGTPEHPLWLVDASQNPIVLDLNALKPILKKRREDLYYDGEQQRWQMEGSGVPG